VVFSFCFGIKQELDKPRHQMQNSPQFVRYGFWFLLVFHIIGAVLTLSVLFPIINSSERQKHCSRWSKWLLKIAGLQLLVEAPYGLPKKPCLIASNHISWIDTHVINSFISVSFVAKSEVASWPVFGWISKKIGTMFIRRDSARHARQIVDQMAQDLSQKSFCIFPEGTTTEGSSLLPFKASLFESAVISKAQVWSLAIQYRSRVTGKRSTVPAFIGDMGILESMEKIMSDRQLEVKVVVLPTFDPVTDLPLNRSHLAQKSYELVARSI
jgi:1-acyl-sn-glycerol-3-phosphate acyltransferase